MTKPKSVLHETYKGYQIRYRPWCARRPWRVQIPNPDDRNLWADVAEIQAAHNLIDYLLSPGSSVESAPR